MDARVKPAHDSVCGGRLHTLHTQNGCLLQIAAEALDTAAGLFQVLGLGRVGNAERRAQSESRALHDRNAFRFQQLGDEILVGRELLAASAWSCPWCRRRTDRHRTRLPASGT